MKKYSDITLLGSLNLSGSMYATASNAVSASYAESIKPFDYYYSPNQSSQTSFIVGDILKEWNGGFNQGEITYNNTTGEFTLKEGKTYELEAHIYVANFSNSTGGFFYVGFEVVSGTGNFYHSDASALPVSYTGDDALKPVATALAKPTGGDMNVRLKVKTGSGSGDIFYNFNYKHSSVKIKEIR